MRTYSIIIHTDTIAFAVNPETEIARILDNLCTLIRQTRSMFRGCVLRDCDGNACGTCVVFDAVNN
jgi:hypothetical protein